MKLFYGGFGDYKTFAVAEDPQSAIESIGKKINAPFLPVTVEEISEVDGFSIQAFGKNEPIPQEVEPIEEDKPATLRQCKKCDFACESQGELLKHYREEHPKGD